MSLGVLKIKAKLGELMPAKPPAERGQEGGRGNKKASNAALPAFTKPTIAAYRKIAKHRDRLAQGHVVRLCQDRRVSP